ncbi:9307_t:CDS:2 [Entrophospora sp. SA101]|nr:9307_t:CDS:2 [Entrophospora sp. SA101]
MLRRSKIMFNHIRLGAYWKPMYEATKLLSSSSYPTMGDVILAFIGMFTTLDHYLDAQLQ